MKRWKKLVCLAAAVILSLGAAGSALAEPGDNGSITIKETDTSASLKGRTFRAYQILEAVLPEAEAGEKPVPAYTVPASMAGWYRTYFSLDSGLTGSALDRAVTDRIAALTTDTAMQAFAKAALAGAKAAGVTPESVTAGEGEETVSITGLPYGYYAVEDATALSALDEDNQVIAAVSVTTTDPDAEINLKASRPVLDKTILSGNTTADKKANDVSVGGTVQYQLKSSVPDTTGYLHYFFVVEDTMSQGLQYQDNSLSFMIGEDTLTAGTDYTVSAVRDNTTGVTALKVVLKGALERFRNYNAGTEIKICYSATLTEQAAVTVTDPADNTNTAKLIYSNDPKLSTEGGGDEPGGSDPVGETPVSVAKTYTTQLKILKTDGEAPLPGAEFTLTGDSMKVVLVSSEQFETDPAGDYWKLKDGTYTKEAPEGEGAQYESTETKYRRSVVTEVKGEGKTSATVTGTSGDNGEIVFAGLSEGTYHLEETGVPAGYNGIDPFDVTISFHKDPEQEASYLRFSASASFVNGDGETENVQINPGDPIQIRVVNRRGIRLPSTGAGGTLFLSLIGLFLMAAALFGTRKGRETRSGHAGRLPNA